jgi:uncharacterized protein DUF2695
VADPFVVGDVDQHVSFLADELTQVNDEECLYCYLTRMLDAFGCPTGTHRWTERWIAAQPRSAGWVLDWAKRNGGCCCDCEVVMNAFRWDVPTEQRRQLLRCAASCDPDNEPAEQLD